MIQSSTPETSSATAAECGKYGDLFERLGEISQRRWVAALLLLSSVALASWHRIRSIDLEISWRGFTPVAYVYKRAAPSAFSADWTSGIEGYDLSAAMYIYRLSYQLFGIEPERLMVVWIVLEILGVALILVCLTRAVLPTASALEVALVAVLGIGSGVRDMSFARMTQPYFIGQFYNLADVLRMLALVSILRGRAVASGIFLSATVATHLTLGLLGAVFVGATQMVRPFSARLSRLLCGGFVFIVGASGWAWLTMHSADVGGGQVPVHAWFQLTRFFNGHWYPLNWGVFAFLDRSLVPFLSFTLLLVHYMRGSDDERRTRARIAAASATVLFLAALGLANSLFDVSPFVTKLALHRANDLVILCGLPFVVIGLAREIVGARFWRAVAALLIMLSFFSSDARHGGFPFPLLLALVLVLPVAINVVRLRSRDWADITLLALVAVSIALVPIYVSKFSPLASLGKRSVLLLPIFLFLVITRRFPRPLALALLATLCVGVSHRWWNQSSYNPELAATVRDYKLTQLWARDNTASDALFATDPAMEYGWRDFSRRSSFGNLREWLHTSWLYDSNRHVFAQGMERFASFGVPLEPFLLMPPATLPPPRKQLSERMQSQYYQMDDAWRASIAQRYGVDYFVLERKRIRTETHLPVAYENHRFRIVAVPPN